MKRALRSPPKFLSWGDLWFRPWLLGYLLFRREKPPFEMANATFVDDFESCFLVPKCLPNRNCRRPTTLVTNPLPVRQEGLWRLFHPFSPRWHVMALWGAWVGIRGCDSRGCLGYSHG